MLPGFHAILIYIVVYAVETVLDFNANNVEQVAYMKYEFAAIIDPTAVHASKRMTASEPKQTKVYTIEVGITDNLQGVYCFAKRIAKEHAILEAA